MKSNPTDAFCCVFLFFPLTQFQSVFVVAQILHYAVIYFNASFVPVIKLFGGRYFFSSFLVLGHFLFCGNVQKKNTRTFLGLWFDSIPMKTYSWQHLNGIFTQKKLNASSVHDKLLRSVLNWIDWLNFEDENFFL